MSRIPDHLLKSVIYIYSSEEAAQSQEEDGGTGFIYGVEAIPNQYVIYLVTNRHLVKSEKGNRSTYVQLNLQNGGFTTIQAEKDEWIFHPDGSDIAVTPLNLNPDIFDIGFVRRGIDTAGWEDIERFNFGPGDEVFMVGRFVGMRDSTKVRPIVRYGHISSMPTSIIHPISQLKEESFLVDMHSRAGFSGSPVFLQYSFRFETQGSQTSGPWFGSRFIGINWGSWQDKLRVVSERSIGHESFVRIFSNLNYVSPVWKIDEVIDLEELKEARSRASEGLN